MTFTRPGVYVQETLTPLSTTADTNGTAKAVFVGTSNAGPVDPMLVSSWAQYVSVYGGFGDKSSLLPFAVYEYFNNGGGQCYVIRATNADAVAATTTLQDTETTPADRLKFTAKAPGDWGNGVSVTTEANGSGNFNVVVQYGSATERWNDLSLDPAGSRYLPQVINSPYAGSAYVTVVDLAPAGTGVEIVAAQALTGGTEGTGTPDLVAATQKIASVDGIFDINLPGVNNSAVINPLLDWADTQGNVFFVIDGVEGASADTAAQNAGAQQALMTGASAIKVSSMGAIYGPWLVANDPSSTASAQKILPPGGFVLGQYSRTDTVRGVQKPAAGIDATLRGVLGPQYVYAPTDQDTLAAAAINLIKVVPGAGTCIFGARTTNNGMPDRYLSIRRSLIFLKKGLSDLTRFAIFEDNDDDLRALIEDLVSQYLRTQWSQGVLAGSTESEAFSVQCDDSNNTPQSIASGVVNITVGVALQTPAEFIVFNIGQSVSTTSVDETVEA